MSNLVEELYLSKDEKTFEFDENLPDLPLPDLDSSLIRYLNSIGFMLTEQELNLAVESIKKFQVSIGKELQTYLEEKCKLSKNWLQDWWLEYSYLRTREPLIPFSNIFSFYPSPEFWPNNLTNFNQVLYRCALILRYKIEFYKMLKEQHLKPMSYNGLYWSMDQFMKLFNTCRIPGIEKDSLLTSFMKTNSTYITVLFNGHIFTIEVYDKSNDFIFSIQQIYEQLEFIINEEKYQIKRESIACLTLLKRNDWYKNRIKLISNEKNKSNLELIENSLFCIAFEDECPINRKEILEKTIYGDPALRWADKSFTLIFFKNGALGTILDHTPFDGFVMSLLSHFIMVNIKLNKGLWPNELTSHSNVKHNYSTKNLVLELEFNLDSSIQKEILFAKQIYAENCSKIEIAVKTFHGYGKKNFKKYNFQLDELIQVAINLGYYKLNSKYPEMNTENPTTIYSVSTRKFYNGRTETCRTFCKEFKEFSMYTIKNRKFNTKHFNLLNYAICRCQVLISEAMNAYGIDRHFFGLYISLLEKKLEIPEFFVNPLYKKYGPNSNYILTTSCLGYWDISSGILPMREDGYGIFYSIEDDHIHFTIICFKSCNKTSSVLMFNEISNALFDIQCILTKSNI